MKKLLLLPFVSALVIGCSSTQKRAGATDVDIDTLPVLITQIQQCSRLYTTEMRVHKIVTHDDQLQLRGTFLQKDFKIDVPMSNRKIAIPMDATLKAYIDFGHFSTKNIRRSGKKIEIILPDPQIVMTGSRIDHKNIRQYVSMTRSTFSDEELAQYEQQGRASIIASIPKIGMMDLARQNAAHMLIPMIRQMGFEENDITVAFRKEFKLEDLKSIIKVANMEK